jgi:hypothetical protein
MATFLASRARASLPECWGHRGVSLRRPMRGMIRCLTISQASAALPENTILSFKAAIQDGAHGIESGTALTLRPPSSHPLFFSSFNVSSFHFAFFFALVDRTFLPIPYGTIIPMTFLRGQA